MGVWIAAIDGTKDIKTKKSEFNYVALEDEESDTEEITPENQGKHTIFRVKSTENGWLVTEWGTIIAKGKIFFFVFFCFFCFFYF